LISEIKQCVLFYIQNATSADSGVYKILAKNDAGDSQALINLTVDAEPAPPYNDLLHDILYFSVNSSFVF